MWWIEMVPLREELHGEVRKYMREAVRHAGEIVGVAAPTQCEPDPPFEPPQRGEVQIGGQKGLEQSRDTCGSLRHPLRRGPGPWRVELDTRRQLECLEAGHLHRGIDVEERAESLEMGALLWSHLLPSGKRRLHQGEAEETVRVAAGERQRGGTPGRIADEMEPLEASLVGNPENAGDLGPERIVGWWRVAGVQFEVLDPCHHVRAELSQEPVVGWSGRQDAARQEDGGPGRQAYQTTLWDCNPIRILAPASSIRTRELRAAPRQCGNQ